jgi:hypothetical protein
MPASAVPRWGIRPPIVTIGLQWWQYTVELYVKGCRNESARYRNASAVLRFAWRLRDINWLINDARAR